MRDAVEASEAHERLNGVEVDVAKGGLLCSNLRPRNHGIKISDTDKRISLYIALASDSPGSNSADDDPIWEIPDGVRIVEEFVSEAEEDEIIGSLCWNETASEQGSMKHRQVRLPMCY